jgi:hypothetical protein
MKQQITLHHTAAMAFHHYIPLSLATLVVPPPIENSVLTCLHTLTSLRRSCGCSHPDTVAAMRALAHSFIAKSRWCDALTLLEEALPLQIALFGQSHVDSIVTMITLSLAIHVRTRHLTFHTPSQPTTDI